MSRIANGCDTMDVFLETLAKLGTNVAQSWQQPMRFVRCQNFGELNFLDWQTDDNNYDYYFVINTL